MPSLKMIRYVELNKGLYYLRALEIPAITCCLNTKVDCVYTNSLNYVSDIWHLRLGHPSNKVLDQVCTNFPYVKINKNSVCDTCHLAKQSKLPFSSSVTATHKPFELVHMDIWGPLATPSLHGHKYFLTMVDDFTRHTWLFLMKLKSETRNLIENFIIFVRNQFNVIVKTIRSDNGAEFVYPELYNKYGILHHTSCVATPQKNLVVERKHLHILNVT